MKVLEKEDDFNRRVEGVRALIPLGASIACSLDILALCNVLLPNILRRKILQIAKQTPLVQGDNAKRVLQE